MDIGTELSIKSNPLLSFQWWGSTVEVKPLFHFRLAGIEKTASTASAACRKWRSNQDLAENFGKVQQKK